jgi:hypothetical protein
LVRRRYAAERLVGREEMVLPDDFGEAHRPQAVGERVRCRLFEEAGQALSISRGP